MTNPNPSSPAKPGAANQITKAAPSKDANIGQGANANGEEDAKLANAAARANAQTRAQAESNPAKAARIAAEHPDHSASTMTLGGVTKVLREEGRDRSKDGADEPVVQQGGGGAIPAKGA